MRLWTYSLREALRRPGRTLLTLLAVAIGTASLAATVLTNQAVGRAYRDLFSRVSGPAALEAVAAGQGGFDPACADGLADVPGVKAVIPRVQAMAALAGPPTAEPTLVIGVAPDQAAGGPDLHIVAGRLATGDDEIVLEAGRVRERGLVLGNRVRMWTPTGLAELRLTGAVEDGLGDGTAHLAVLSLGAAQRLFRLPNQVNNLHILLQHGADAARVESLVAPRLPPGVSVQGPGARAELAGATLAAIRRGLECLCAAVMVGAVFVVCNTFRLSAGERRRTLASLRAFGATRRQVVLLLLAEALALGTAGAVLGTAAAPVLAAVLVRALGGLDPAHAAHGYAALLPVALVGPAAAVAAAFPSAWAYRSCDLLEELRAPRGADDTSPRFLTALGLALIAAGAGFWLCAARGAVPAAVSRALLAPAVGAFLAGGVLAVPPLLGPLLNLAGRLGSPLFGVEWVLSARQLTRRRARTGLTVGVLFIAAATAVGFGHWLRGSLRDLRHWYARTIVADYLIRGAMPDAAFLTAAPLPDGLAGEIARVDGVAAVDEIAFVPARVNGRPVLVLARTFAADRPLPLDLQEGDADAVRRGLMRGEAVAGVGLARALGLGPGDELTLETPHGQEVLRVAGAATEYAGGGQALYLEWGAARRLLGVSGPHVFLVTACRGGASPAAGLKSFCDGNNLLIQSNGELRGSIERMLGRVGGALWGLLALTFLVAGLGVANTLALNVHEQRREMAVLRALGLQRGQVRRMVLWQAVLMGLAALAPGTLAGLGLAWFLGSPANPAAIQPSPFHFDAGLTAACWAVGLASCALAAFAPAHLALRCEPSVRPEMRTCCRRRSAFARRTMPGRLIYRPLVSLL